ncbi:expressed unknown protein [Seminavis robusta]|uniref:Uncharacterized protein n=1 Tax=Seminavis robusta TaxID=568900 RepID=A0A9N8DFD9_9STRA|nr:expressed unknown protein [Seminavis robusta]|eukprot:Sro43_g026060.1 n/a (426) ;mRNA; r:41805-43174
MNQYPYQRMEFLYRGHPQAANGIIGHHFPRPPFPPAQLRPNFSASAPASSPAAAKASNQGSAEAAVSEALLTLSSAGSPPKSNQSSTSAPGVPSNGPAPFASPPLPPHSRRPSLTFSAPAQPVRRVSLCSPAGFAPHPPLPHPRWPGKFMAPPMMTPQRDIPVAYQQKHHHARPVVLEDAAPPAKKARTVSPAPATTAVAASDNSEAGKKEDIEIVSCICPVCNNLIKGLGENKVDWSQPVQGRQRAKTISSIKKHVKDHHEQEPIWNVIVNSLDVAPTKDAAANRVVNAQAFVTQALKKAALDQIPNHTNELRSLHWTEKIMDQRVGIAKGFIQFGGQEYLRNKECHDETGNKINPKGLRNLAYTLLQSMYDDLMQAWRKNQATIEASMATEPLGLLRNRFQLLFSNPDKWSDSWYMDPSKYSS